MKLLSLKRVHLIGIKGQGMTALAQVLANRGVRVTGSDTDEVFTTDLILKKNKIALVEGFDAKNIPQDADAIIYSTAYTKETNPELEGAYDRAVPVLSYPEALGLLSREHLTIAVCGTHGKTTTTALLGEVLRHAGLDPLVIVGSQIEAWGGNALSGKGQYFILEADEYQNKFQYYSPWGMIVTSLDWDHPDFFPTPEAYRDTFLKFMEKVPGHGFLVACGDDARLKALAPQVSGKKIFYGFHPENEVRIIERTPIAPDLARAKEGVYQEMSVEIAGTHFGPVALRLSGKHNAENVAAVIAVAHQLKIPWEKVAEAIERFQGTKRRFERVGERGGVVVYDDYAHHPEEIRVTLCAFRDLYPSRPVTVIFHPHTYTRTLALLEEFAQCFEDADRVYLLDIYGSAREKRGGVSSRELMERINRYTPGKAEYAEDGTTLVETLRQTLDSGDIVVTMGAGDVWKLAEALVKK